MCAFYVETLELPVVGGFPGHDIIFVGVGDTTVEIIGERASAPRPIVTGWHHLAWEVTNVDAAFAELSARGVTPVSPPESFPPEAPTMRIAFFRDPDGNVLEIVQPLGRRFPTLHPEV